MNHCSECRQFLIKLLYKFVYMVHAVKCSWVIRKSNMDCFSWIDYMDGKMTYIETGTTSREIHIQNFWTLLKKLRHRRKTYPKVLLWVEDFPRYRIEKKPWRLPTPLKNFNHLQFFIYDDPKPDQWGNLFLWAIELPAERSSNNY